VRNLMYFVRIYYAVILCAWGENISFTRRMWSKGGVSVDRGRFRHLKKYLS
jgi:hypothetical protein